jgi:sulfite reductase alpha subunit-like flavoprotein
MDIKKYLDKLDEKLDNKKLDNFWLLVDRVDFKPIKGLTDKEFRKKIKDKVSYYAGKRIANVTIHVKNRNSCIKKKDSLVHLVFDIRKITDSGLAFDTGDSLKVLYYEDDLEEKKPTLKDVQRFMKLCADGVLGSSTMGGIKYSKLMNKLKEKKIKF